MDHDYATDPSNQKSQSQLLHENQLLRNRIKEMEEKEAAMKRNEIAMQKNLDLIEESEGRWKKRANELQLNIIDMKSGQLPKYVKEAVTREMLAGQFSEASIDFFLSKKPKRASTKWDKRDLRNGWRLLLKGRKAFDHVRTEHPFLVPSHTLLQKKFGFLSTLPGVIKPIYVYIKVHLSHTDKWKNGLASLLAICFDEVYLRKMGLYDSKFDMILGRIHFDRKHTRQLSEARYVLIFKEVNESTIYTFFLPFCNFLYLFCTNL